MEEHIKEGFAKYLISIANVSDSEIYKLIALYKSTDYKKGSLVLQKGSNSEAIYFVEKGLLRMYSIDQNGKEHIMQFAPENWWLSDRNNLCYGEPSEFYIDAYEDTTVVILNHNFISKASAISDSFRNFHERILQRHINSLYRRINMLISSPAKDRYLDFLKTYPNISQRVPQWMVASYLGITPEGLSRVRKEISK
jgi:CRP/FNR family transcriptional regulator, anaerobic regulatory protein